MQLFTAGCYFNSFITIIQCVKDAHDAVLLNVDTKCVAIL